MNALQKILLPLLIIPFGMFMYVFTHPDWPWENPGLENLFAVIGIPILIINFIAWFHPQIITAYFPLKEDWGQRGNRPVTFAIVISTLVAMICVSVGAVSAITNASARPTSKAAAVQPVTATAFAHSIQLISSPADSDQNVTVSIPQPSSEANITDSIPDPTPLIPVSGENEAPTDVPTQSVTRTEPTTELTSTSSEPTSTLGLSARCMPVTPEYLEVISQVVEDADPDSEVETGWIVQSKQAGGLWLVAAKIHKLGNDNNVELTSPGVWGLFDYSDGNFDIYAINDIAMELSYAAWGEDSEPILTMQSDGAQAAYDCAAQAE
jgi:hypothetical protein